MDLPVGGFSGANSARAPSQARELSFEGLAEEDNLLAATWEVTRAGHSVLIFCSSKALKVVAREAGSASA